MLNRRTTAAALVAVLLGGGVAGCAQPDPVTGQSRQGLSQTGTGAVIGAIGGAALGALTGEGGVERRQRALIGAGIGALAGGAVGSYMTQQEQQFRQELAATPVQVERVQETIVLTVPSGVTFETDRARLLPAAQESLNDVARVLAKNAQTTIDVIGYTDAQGAQDYNLRLSEARAQAVGNYLVSRGIDPSRVLIAGRGEANPVATNATAEGRAMNRRVEIRINPVRQPGA
jgi:outer membrane protein OmpA-like peptidoglycan-associated protein